VLADAADTRAADAVKQYVSAYQSPRSRENARDALRRIARMVMGPGAQAESFPWPAISYELATRIRRGLYDLTTEGAISPGTANLTLSHLRGIVRTMYLMKIVDHETVVIAQPSILKNVTGSRGTRGVSLSYDNELVLREAARDLGGYRAAMLDTAIVTAIGAGLRREELVGVLLGSLGPRRMTVIGKGNKERKMPVDAGMQRALDGWFVERARLLPEHQSVFCAPWRPDNPLSKWSFWDLVREAAHLAFGSVDPCADECRCFDVVTGPHDFRRTFASRLLEQGFDIGQVQELMGHESPTTTARYDKRDKDALFEKRLSVRVTA